ncbi:hypothetical protein JCM17823_30140 [Halorubrum gandharaense]
MTTDDHDSLHLNTAYRYDGEETTTIPYTDLTDLGGSVVVECPDGSVRMFDKEEVVE